MDEQIQAARVAFGNRVRKLREAQNVSLRGFALMVGIDKTFLMNVEKGRKSPTLDTIIKIASGLGISPAELFEDVDG